MLMGQEIFDKVHSILQLHKKANSEPEDVQASLKEFMGKNRKLKDHIFALEMIVFKEN